MNNEAGPTPRSQHQRPSLATLAGTILFCVYACACALGRPQPDAEQRTIAPDAPNPARTLRVPGYVGAVLTTLFVTVLLTDILAAILTRKTPPPDEQRLLLQLAGVSMTVAFVLLTGFIISARATGRNPTADPELGYTSVVRIPDLLIMVIVAAAALTTVAFCDNPVSNAGIALAPIVAVILLGDHPGATGKRRFMRIVDKHRHLASNAPGEAATSSATVNYELERVWSATNQNRLEVGIKVTLSGQP